MAKSLGTCGCLSPRTENYESRMPEAGQPTQAIRRRGYACLEESEDAEKDVEEVELIDLGVLENAHMVNKSAYQAVSKQRGGGGWPVGI